MASFPDAAAAFFASSVDLLRARNQIVSLRETHTQLGTEALAQVIHVGSADLELRLKSLFNAFNKENPVPVWTYETYYHQFHQVVLLLLTLMEGRIATSNADGTDATFDSHLDALLRNLTTSLYCKVNACFLGGERAVADVKPDDNAGRREDVRSLFNSVCGAGSSVAAKARVAGMISHVAALKPAVPLPKGIYNPDSVCYAISTVQMLYACPAFRKAVLDAEFLPRPCGSSADAATDVPHARSAAAVAQELQKLFALLGCRCLLDYVDFETFLERYFHYQTEREQAGVAMVAGDEMGSSVVASAGEVNVYSVETQRDAAAFLSELLQVVHVAFMHSVSAPDYCSDNKDKLCVHQFHQGFWFNVLDGAAAGEAEAGAGRCAPHVDSNAAPPVPAAPPPVSRKKEAFHVLKLNVTSPRSQPSSDAAFSIDFAIDKFFSQRSVAHHLPTSTPPATVTAGWAVGAEGGADGTLPALPVATVSRVEPACWPPYLFVQPKRFGFDKERLERFKMRNTEAKFVFAEHIDLTRHNGGKYALAGVVIHSGTATEGHYYSFLRQPSGAASEWALCDDDEVSLCSYKRVVCEAAAVPSSQDPLLLPANEGEDERDWTVDNETSAYLLIYASECDGSGSGIYANGRGEVESGVQVEAEAELSEALQDAVDVANCEYCIDYLLGEL